MKIYKGEKYIYLLMAYKLAKLNNNVVSIGDDNGFKGEYNYQRHFKIESYNNKNLLVETKTSSGFVDYSRVFEIINPTKRKPTIQDYMNEDGENAGQRWTH